MGQGAPLCSTILMEWPWTGAGNVYVSTNKNTIRKVTPKGVVTTLAGAPGVSGTANGKGGAALFWNPKGVAVDSGANVYVADDNTIRKVTPQGVVTTLAGKPGVSGTANGTGSAAQFEAPSGVAVDGSGNVYVADGNNNIASSNNNTIRKVTPGGVVTTIGGAPRAAGWVDGLGSAALFSGPGGVSVSSAGILYVADSFNNRVSKGVLVTPATSGSIKVTISPAGAVTAGAQWRVDFGPWQSSGATVSELPPGSHLINFNTVGGYSTPAGIGVTLSAQQSETETGTYKTVIP